MTELLQYGGAFILTLCLIMPSGTYLYKVFCGEEVFLSGVLIEQEERIYRFFQINTRLPMDWRHYVRAIAYFHGIGFLLFYLWIVLELHLPHVSETVTANSWSLALVSAVSFLLHIPQPVTLSILAQGAGLILQNLTAASLVAICFAVIGTFFRKQKRRVNHYWVDLIRVELYLFLPLAMLCGCILFVLSMLRFMVPAVCLVQLEISPAFIVFRGAIGLFSLFWLPASLCVVFGRYVQDRILGMTVCVIMLILQAAVFIAVQQMPDVYGFSMLYSLYEQHGLSADLILLLSELNNISFGGTGGVCNLMIFVFLSILFTGCCRRVYKYLTDGIRRQKTQLHKIKLVK